MTNGWDTAAEFLENVRAVALFLVAAFGVSVITGFLTEASFVCGNPEPVGSSEKCSEMGSKIGPYIALAAVVAIVVGFGPAVCHARADAVRRKQGNA